MLDDFFIRACIGGMAIAIIAGPIGSIVVWNRLAFFGDALAHASLLGVALGVLFHISPFVSVVGCAVLFATVLLWFQGYTLFSKDTMLNMVAQAALALGLIVVSLFHIPMDMEGILFGDVLTLTHSDIGMVIGLGLVIGYLLKKMWHGLLLVAVNEDIAKIEGIPVAVVKYKFMLLLSLMVALGIKIVGVILVTSLLVMPAAIARRFAATPEHMAYMASVVGVVTVLSGLMASWLWDIPAGPAVVVISFLLFIGSTVIAQWRQGGVR